MLRRAAFLALLLVPLALADVPVATGAIDAVGGVALADDAFAAFWTEYDDPTIWSSQVTSQGASAREPIATVEDGYFVRYLDADASAGRLGALVVLWSDAGGDNRARVLLDDGAWSAREVPLDASHLNAIGLAIAPDGTAYAMRSGIGGQDLVALRADGTEIQTLSTWLGFPDVAVDAAGAPHACVSTPLGLVEWTPSGVAVVLPPLPGLNAYFCAIAIAPNGSAAIVAAQPPLFGGSCYLPDVCVSPGGGTLVSATRPPDGAWSFVVSTIPFYGDLQAGVDPSGRFFAMHNEGNRDRILAIDADGLSTLEFVQPQGSAMPQRNLAEPVVVARVTDDETRLVIRPIG